jgi:hypothetical protein
MAHALAAWVTTMLAEVLEPVRPVLAAAQAAGEGNTHNGTNRSFAESRPRQESGWIAGPLSPIGESVQCERHHFLIGE